MAQFWVGYIAGIISAIGAVIVYIIWCMNNAHKLSDDALSKSVTAVYRKNGLNYDVTFKSNDENQEDSSND